MILVQNKFTWKQTTGFFAALRMTLLVFVKSESLRPSAAATQTTTLRLLSSRMKRNEGSWYLIR